MDGGTMGGRSVGVATIAVAMLILPAVATSVSADQSLEMATVEIVEPDRGETITDEFAVTWEMQGAAAVQEVDVQLEYLCPRLGQIQILADQTQMADPGATQTVRVDPDAERLPDCDDADLRLLVDRGIDQPLLDDTVAISMDRQPPRLDIWLETYNEQEGTAVLAWKNADGNRIPTVRTAIDTSTDSTLDVDHGLADEARQEVDLTDDALVDPWRAGDLAFLIDCDAVVGKPCTADNVPIPQPNVESPIQAGAEASVRISYDHVPDGPCEGTLTVRGSAQVATSSPDGSDAIEEIQVKHEVEGTVVTDGFVRARPGPDGSWSTWRFPFVCSTPGSHRVTARAVLPGGVPTQPSYRNFTLHPPERSIYDDLSVALVDTTECDGNATGRIEVVGSVGQVDLVEARLGDGTWRVVQRVEDPQAMAAIAAEAGVTFPTRAAAAFRHNLDCPGPGQSLLKVRSVSVADSTETWRKLIEIGPPGSGPGQVIVGVGPRATKIDDLPGDAVRAIFNAEALSTLDRPDGIKQLEIVFEGDPDHVRLRYAADVETPPVRDDLLVVGTFDLTVEDESGRKVPVTEAAIDLRIPGDDLARARASFDDPVPYLMDRDDGRWRLVEAASVADAGDGRLVRFEMTGDDLFSPFATSYGPPDAASDDGGPWSGLALDDLAAGLVDLGWVGLVAVGLVALLAGVAAARLVVGRSPPFDPP